MKSWGAVLAVVVTVAVGAWGQSLEDLAKKEKARRKSTPPAKTFTNDDIAKPSPSPSPTAESQAAPGKGVQRRFFQPGAGAEGGSPTEKTEGRASEGGESEASSPSVGDAGAEAYWRGRAQALRDTADKTQQGIAALEARIAQLQLDRDPNPPDQFDPNRLQKREAERMKAVDELDKARATLAQAQQALQALADEARQKGAPLSWVQ